MSQSVTVAHLKAHLSELIKRAEEGEDVMITRHGQEVARLSAVRKMKQLQSKQAFRDRFPPLDVDSVKVISDLRDEARY